MQHLSPRQDNPNVIELRYGGGVVIVVGLIVLLLGCLIFALGLGLFLPPTGTPSTSWQVVGLLIVAIGTFVCVYQQRLSFDRRTGVMTKSIFIVLPIFRREQALQGYIKVRLSKWRRPGKENNTIRYPVVLEPSRTSTKLHHIRIESGTDYQQARRSAELLATWLKLPLVDSSSGNDVVRNAESLNMSLQQRLRKHDTQYKLREPSPHSTFKITLQGRALHIEIPAHKHAYGWHAVVEMLLLFAVMTGMIAMMVVEMIKNPHHTMLLVMLLPFVLALLWRLRKTMLEKRNRRHERIILDPQELCIDVKHTASSTAQRQKISLRELEELDLIDLDGGRRALMARSDATTLVFGLGLSAAELGYLKVRLHKALVEM